MQSFFYHSGLIFFKKKYSINMKSFVTNPNEKQVKEWKDKYGEGLICFEDETGGLFYFQPVERLLNYIQIISKVISFVRKDDIVSAGQVLVSNTAIGGACSLKDNHVLSVSVGMALVAEMNLPSVVKKKIA